MSEQETNKIVFKRNGDLTLKEDGQETVIAHYDRPSGYLEFATKDYSQRHYSAVITRIATVSNGTAPSQNVIRSFGVKGDDRPDMKNAPKRPKLGVLGDAAADIVEWYLAHDMPQAIIRYGLYLDDKGRPIRKKVRRVIENTVDVRNSVEDNDLEPVKDGKSSQAKAPVYRERELIEMDNAYIGRRATALTFMPQEVVGGFQPEEDFESAQVAGEDES